VPGPEFAPTAFSETHAELKSVDALHFSDKQSYADRLTQAREKTGLPEAVITGTAKVAGLGAVFAVSDFGFMGGTMGYVVGEKVALAMELAERRHLPFVAVCASGGARMQRAC